MTPAGINWEIFGTGSFFLFCWDNLSPVSLTPGEQLITGVYDTGDEHKVVNISVNFRKKSKCPQWDTYSGARGKLIYKKKWKTISHVRLPLNIPRILPRHISNLFYDNFWWCRESDPSVLPPSPTRTHPFPFLPEMEFVKVHFHWGFWVKSREFSDLRFLP